MAITYLKTIYRKLTLVLGFMVPRLNKHANEFYKVAPRFFMLKKVEVLSKFQLKAALEHKRSVES